MSHNLNFKNGRASFASAKEVPWHGLGKVLDHVMTAEEAIMNANLDFIVEKGDLYVKYKLPMSDKRGQLITDKFATYRTDTGQVLGIVGSKYTVIQNTEIFSFFDTLVDKGEAIYETAGCLGNGEVIFITAKLPKDIIVGKDVINQYLLITTSHDGSGTLKILFTPTRVVCQNTLNFALSGKKKNIVELKHTRNVKEKIQMAHTVLGISRDISTQYTEMMNLLTKKKVDDPTLKYLVNQLFLTKEELGKLEDLNTIDVRKVKDISTRKVNMINNMYEYSLYGLGQDTEETKGTAYGFLQGVVGFFHNSKEWDSSEDEFKSLFSGSTRTYQQKAFELAMSV